MNNNKGHLADLLQVLDTSRTLALNQDLHSLLKQIEQAAVSVLNCERATVFVHQKNTDELYSYVFDRDDYLRVHSDSGIVGSCFKSGKLINVEDAYKDPRFNFSIDQQTGFKTRNILAAPLFSDSHDILGVLEVLNKIEGPFNEWDVFLLESFSAQCGIAIHRNVLMKEFVERKRLQQELTIARRIQRSLLPQSAPVIEGYDIAGWNQSAEETGGDFFDFHIMDENNLMLILADVAGHGIGPALLAAECWALQNAIFSIVPEYHTSLSRINHLLCKHIPDDRFITVFASYLNTKNNTLNFISAGQGPIFIFRSATQSIEILPVTGIPLGILKDYSYDQWTTCSLESGDMLIALTDGFFEWENKFGNSIGIDRICEMLVRHAELPVAEIIEKIHSNLISFCEGTHQQDDLTAIVVKKLKSCN